MLLHLLESILTHEFSRVWLHRLPKIEIHRGLRVDYILRTTEYVDSKSYTIRFILIGIKPSIMQLARLAKLKKREDQTPFVF